MANKKPKWSWLTEKDIDCLVQLSEASQEEILLFGKKEDTRLRTEVAINPHYQLQKGKIIVVVSYQDVKRIFKSMDELNEHFKNNLYLRNTEKKVGDEVRLKKRTRFFVVPANFSKFCMSILDKVADPESGIDDINQLVTELRASQKPEDKTISDEVQKDIIKEIDEENPEHRQDGV